MWASTLSSNEVVGDTLLAPVLRPVVSVAMGDTVGMKGTLRWSLPHGAPSWDSAAGLGTAGCNYQEWVPSRACRVHMTVLKKVLSKFIHV